MCLQGQERGNIHSFHRFIHLDGKLLHTVKERVWKDAHLSLGRAGLPPLQGVATAGSGVPGGEGRAPGASALGLKEPTEATGKQRPGGVSRCDGHVAGRRFCPLS